MTFNRDLLPDAMSYFEAQGLKLAGPRNAKWKTTACQFHGGSDSMRINTETGAFACMAGCHPICIEQGRVLSHGGTQS